MTLQFQPLFQSLRSVDGSETVLPTAQVVAVARLLSKTDEGTFIARVEDAGGDAEYLSKLYGSCRIGNYYTEVEGTADMGIGDLVFINYFQMPNGATLSTSIVYRHEFNGVKLPKQASEILKVAADDLAAAHDHTNGHANGNGHGKHRRPRRSVTASEMKKVQNRVAWKISQLRKSGAAETAGGRLGQLVLTSFKDYEEAATVLGISQQQIASSAGRDRLSTSNAVIVALSEYSATPRSIAKFVVEG